MRAAEIDPLNSAIVGDVGFILFHADRQEVAIETLNRVIQMAPDYVLGYLGLGAANLALQKYDDSIRWHEKAVEVSGGDSVAILDGPMEQPGEAKKPLPSYLPRLNGRLFSPASRMHGKQVRPDLNTTIPYKVQIQSPRPFIK
jgi:tetratricopeptide (TPR) repeat protein